MRVTLICVLVAVLFGCSDKPAESFLQDEQQLMEKARQTEDMLKAADDKRREQLEEIQ